ncbi:electron transport complex protein RnfG [Marinitoga hydrogenitolerans DSM 16785]|uniref:Ion-translocating oxidoreductase complex subunit G n=1 Tax=Marinitoga hydrogenitolerans (strain DSM 16785 / JCM 12826 / AT1271) TaxID=1122195 RepID=A0A1M4W0G3_MARH1|nr:RnfABCDGE type electron transport complex subunit G [Marinitoga hydrogenitolerans]SHE74738.1 electron transport complex protein RnfG [Marinitoga hydrogenitolerans DSM 16785]
MKEYIKTGFILMLFIVISGFIVSIVYVSVKPAIDNAELQAKLKAIKKVLENSNGEGLLISKDEIPKTSKELENAVWDSNENGILYSNANSKVYSPVYRYINDKGQEIYILTVSSVGFGGEVISVISFVKDKVEKIYFNGLEVISYSQETPGLGANIAQDNVKKRFYPISYEGLIKGVKVNKDAGVLLNTPEKMKEGKEKGIIQTSDIMTGATITPRAVANSINAGFEYLKSKGVIQ